MSAAGRTEREDGTQKHGGTRGWGRWDLVLEKEETHSHKRDHDCSDWPHLLLCFSPPTPGWQYSDSCIQLFWAFYLLSYVLVLLHQGICVHSGTWLLLIFRCIFYKPLFTHALYCGECVWSEEADSCFHKDQETYGKRTQAPCGEVIFKFVFPQTKVNVFTCNPSKWHDH